MLWLVTPVHGRVVLTRIVLEQRARMLQELALLGVQARQLVVGDDANLATARELGFETLERPNVVGLRVNDGIEWAAREGEASHVAYCGSDDWHLADYFAALPAPGTAKTCRWQAFVSPTGTRLVAIKGTAASGHAPWIITRELLEPTGFRPARDHAMSAVDASIYDGLLARLDPLAHRDERRAAFVFDDGADLLRMVDFKGGGEQITPWGRVVRRGGPPPELDSSNPFDELARRYPADLVERMEKFYATKEAR